MHILLRAALVGLASGMRTATGIAVVARTASPDASRQPDKLLAVPLVRTLLALGAAQELVIDKIPTLPPRSDSPYFLGRLVAGGVSAGCLSVRHDAAGPRTVAAVAVGVAAAAVTTALGPIYRAALADLFASDAPGATIEDLLAVLLARSGAHH